MPTKQLTIGDMNLLVINEGFSSYEPTFDLIQQRYPNATKAEFEDSLAQLRASDISADESHMNTLIIEHQGRRVLVDTGMGSASPRPEYGHTVSSMREAGITPEQIDIVFITHFHGDHINGLLTDGVPTFPNARYVTHQAEWHYWMSAEAIKENPQRAAGYVPTMEALTGKFSFVMDGETVMHGVTVVDAFGHSPGHSVLLIESQGEKLLHLVDTLHHPAQMIYPNWHIAFDSDGAQAEATRRALLGRAADENLLTLFYHLPFPALGHIERAGDAFRWQPLAD